MIVMITTTGFSEPIQSVPVTVDTKGRVRTSKEQRCGILAEFERSGVSAAEFAKQSGIKYSTFAGWLQRHRRARPKGQPPAMRLLEAVVEPAQGGAASSAVIVCLADGSRIEITDAKQIPLAAALVRALAQPC
jgi:transposase-like protein